MAPVTVPAEVAVVALVAVATGPETCEPLIEPVIVPAVAAVFAFSALVALATALDTWEPLILPVIVPAVVAVFAVSALLATDALPAKAADGTVGRSVTLSCAAVIVWFSSLVPETE